MASAFGDTFPALTRLKIEIWVPIGYYGYCFDNGMVAPKDLFEVPLVKEGRVIVDAELLLKAELLTMHWDFIEEGVDANVLEKSDQNYVVYRGTPADGPYTYEGLELFTQSAGTFDYEAEVAAVRAAAIVDAWNEGNSGLE